MPLRKMCSPPPLGGWFCTYLSNPPDTMCSASPHFQTFCLEDLSLAQSGAREPPLIAFPSFPAFRSARLGFIHLVL